MKVGTYALSSHLSKQSQTLLLVSLGSLNCLKSERPGAPKRLTVSQSAITRQRLKTGHSKHNVSCWFRLPCHQYDLRRFSFSTIIFRRIHTNWSAWVSNPKDHFALFYRATLRLNHRVDQSRSFIPLGLGTLKKRTDWYIMDVHKKVLRKRTSLIKLVIILQLVTDTKIPLKLIGDWKISYFLEVEIMGQETPVPVRLPIKKDVAVIIFRNRDDIGTYIIDGETVAEAGTGLIVTTLEQGIGIDTAAEVTAGVLW
ncbi:AMP-dependent synthetase and ligase family protein [Artemisia annua]|uniref:AMP-dependent synthetase and ligase family protein n=1 Tax=Artemisia annua TaxID=35608 RepID=A0A2U1KMW7_ARTAN|nr:AMP-dependent synthetase and ligase family protein [Artemisia annua]